ncbi:peptidase S8 [Mesorhizobium sp. M1C.F.Ca.ET.193.01.1.1]|uniref:S8 family serine peptidase n=1 Tax=unclassified Mesorhizobium TaxID=325217 RepID=UPI000FD2C6A1|nr:MULTISPECIES: S8 family serine peptidase [unclassified Mesorhizobium]TGS92563.1 peptidase S8 [bacterium M00.F.Ca.ET.177.01.1.1]TGQ50277.1 peptidase S8 [Mesorhizobium sp. M1C.F.Ca.ET.210.01.1.1]TGQ65209.1 peptidase S8 [Mesorhizobium sp. M1C.F.Ca.ET.212.01.1.1]TGQ98935.1 peptidase S8 [Mesorhizobium sp. M1C.F.Ca.ET.204.01.1.1]TGR19171.1 peptidase S8 [Mesorhizobium sp. M1C.F.Ca.ET.196.01.1.1]
MAAKAVILHAALLAAAFVAAPALAQTNDPSLSQKQVDCLNRTTAAGADCDKNGGDKNGGDKSGTGSAAVFLPALIVDLFPNPPASPAPANPSNGAAQTGGPTNTPPPAPAPSGPVTPPAGLNLAAPPRAVSGEFVPDEVLVTVAGDAGAVQQIANFFGLQVRSERQSRLLGTTLVRYGIPDGRPVGVVLAQLAADGRTQRREPNHIYSLQQAAGIVNYAFDRIALDARNASGENVRVAVIDTGIDATNPALKGVIANQFDAMPNVPIEKRDHGTSVDGLIAGIGALEGMAPGARIYHARAFEGGKSTMDVILSALDWAAEQDVRIINMSFVGPKNDLLGTACRNARALGMVLVAAAGNNGPKAPYGYPAAFDGVIAVTATDAKDGLMPQANRGAYVFISAPGVEMVAPSGAGSDVVTGTSFAAAIVSGAIANLIHAAPDRSADDIEKALAATAKDLGPKGRDNDFGYGLLDIKAAGAAKE